MNKFIKIMKGFTLRMKAFIVLLEAALAVVMLIMVILSFLDLAKLVTKVVESDAITSYTLVQQILAHALLLVIGIELAVMLINHSPSGVLEVALYAVAKKMLISSGSTLDLLIGTLALAVLFAIDKYLHTRGNMGALFKMPCDEVKEEKEMSD